MKYGKEFCRLMETEECRYAGNKRFNYGFVQGTAQYCRYKKCFVSLLEKCPLPEELKLAPRPVSGEDREVEKFYRGK